MINTNMIFIYKKFKLVESYNFNKICLENLYLKILCRLLNVCNLLISYNIFIKQLYIFYLNNISD